MKKLTLLFVLLPVLAFSQSINRYDTVTRKDTTGISKVQLSSRTYTSATKDTSVPYQSVDWKNTYVSVQSLDSARCTVKYQLSLDGTNWSLLTTKDSLSTTQAAGDLKSIDLTSTILGAPYFRLIFDFTTAGSPQGTTTNTYSVTLTRKQD